MPQDPWIQLIDIGKDILSAQIDPTTGVITCQSGNATDSTADTDSSEMWGPPGFYGIPAAPTPGAASCQQVVLKYADHDLIVGTRDTRDSPAYGNLKQGDRAILAGYPSSGAVLVRNGGAVALQTTDTGKAATGNSIWAGLSPNAASGSAGGEWRVFAAWGQQTHDATGFHVRTWHGAKFDMGGLGLPAPFNIFGSMATLTADIITLDAAVLNLGRDTGTTQSVVQAVPLAAITATLALAMTGIQVALDDVIALLLLTTCTNAAGPQPLNATSGTAYNTALGPLTGLAAATNLLIIAANTALGTVALPSPAGTATRSSIA